MVQNSKENVIKKISSNFFRIISQFRHYFNKSYQGPPGWYWQFLEDTCFSFEIVIKIKFYSENGFPSGQGRSSASHQELNSTHLFRSLKAK